MGDMSGDRFTTRQAEMVARLAEVVKGYVDAHAMWLTDPLHQKAALEKANEAGKAVLSDLAGPR